MVAMSGSGPGYMQTVIITPYVHSLIYHVPVMLRRHGRASVAKVIIGGSFVLTVWGPYYYYFFFFWGGWGGWRYLNFTVFFKAIF